MSRFKSINALVGIALVFSFTLGTGAVAAAASHHARPAAQKPFKGVHLTVWDFFPYTPFNTPERVTFTKLANQWAKANGATITDTQPAAGVNPAFIADPKKGPDVLMGPDDEVGAWEGSHLLSPTKLDRTLYTPAANAGCTLAGKTWCYPWALESIMLYYNKAYVSASQMAKLKTWAELGAWANKFHSQNPSKYGFADQISETYKANPFLTAYGGGDLQHTAKGYTGKVILNSSATVKGLDLFKSFFGASGSGAVDKYLLDGSYDGDLTNGTAAIVLTGPWDDANYKGHINYGVAPLPGVKVGKKIEYGKTFLGVQTLAVNKYSKNQKAAQAFAAWAGIHMELPLYHVGARIPASKAGLKAVASIPELKEYGKQFLHAEPLPNVPQMGYVWNCAADAIELTFKGNGTAASNLATAQAKVDSYIKAGSGSCAGPS